VRVAPIVAAKPVNLIATRGLLWPEPAYMIRIYM
jgi:hypothetical protein